MDPWGLSKAGWRGSVWGKFRSPSQNFDGKFLVNLFSKILKISSKSPPFAINNSGNYGRG
jgi:hypothetical protein